MAFSLVRPSGFAFGSKLLSSEMDQFDADHVKALDKSVANDNLEGTIGFVGSGNINANIGGAIQANATAAIESLVSEGIVSGVANGIASNTASGIVGTAADAIVPTTAGGISDGGVTGGIRVTVAQGIKVVSGSIVSDSVGGIQSLVAGGITDGVVGGIEIGNTAGLQTTVPGGIELAGGSTDWIKYSTTRTITRRYALGGAGASGGQLGSAAWLNGYLNGPAAEGQATSTIFIFPLNYLFDGSLNGALLTAASLDFVVAASHSSTSGMSFPSVAITRWNGVTPSTLFTGSMSAANNAAWTGGSAGTEATYSIPISGSALEVDQSTYRYVLTMIDENGSNSVAGNSYLSLALTFANIGNSAPG